MEQFNDTQLVNGTAYPTVTLEPKAYRSRYLNATNDRFFNFQWYVADATTSSTALNSLGLAICGTKVAFNPAELAAAQFDPVVFPTPGLTKSPAGPDWIHFGSEGGPAETGPQAVPVLTSYRHLYPSLNGYCLELTSLWKSFITGTYNQDNGMDWSRFYPIAFSHSSFGWDQPSNACDSPRERK